MIKRLNRILLWTYVRIGVGKGLMRYIMKMTHKTPAVRVEYGWVQVYRGRV